MKYKVLRGVGIAGTGYQPGAIVDIDDARTANELMGNGKIIPHDEPVIENRSVGLEDSPEQPATRKRGRPKKVDDDS